MTKPIIHFAHANGFPARTYTKLFSFLEPDFEIRFLERHGHDPRLPVTDGWDALKDELRNAVEADFIEPVIGLGHSLGGILHLLVSVDRPELYRRIILLDAPIISRRSSRGIRIMKALNLMDRFSMSRQTRARRNFWPSREAAYEHFKSKPKFSAFDDEVLRDYIQFGMKEADGGFRLFFEPQIEAAIYRNLPHDLPSLRGMLSVPVTYVGGTNSREARLARLSFMQRHFDIDFHFLEGSHLFPFEKPEATASMILSLLGH
ncbi:MAG: alpha/beta fold hydrolase [Pyrinomonadaceae bacterium]